jgi:hypothetical protein
LEIAMSNASEAFNSAFADYADYCAAGGEGVSRVRLLTRSPASALAQLFLKTGVRQLPPGTVVELIFTDRRPQAAIDVLAAAVSGLTGRGAKSHSGIRHAKGKKYERCNEQLTLGDFAYLCGPVVSDTTNDVSRLELWTNQDGGDVAVANFAFEMVWGAAEKIATSSPDGGHSYGASDTDAPPAKRGGFASWFGTKKREMIAVAGQLAMGCTLRMPPGGSEGGGPMTCHFRTV